VKKFRKKLFFQLFVKLAHSAIIFNIISKNAFLFITKPFIMSFSRKSVFREKNSTLYGGQTNFFLVTTPCGSPKSKIPSDSDSLTPN